MSADLAFEYLTKWYSIVFGAALIYGIARYIKIQLVGRKHGCEEPPFLPDAKWTAIPIMIRVVKAKNEGQLVDLAQSFMTSDRRTTHVYLGPAKIILTVDPENIKTMLATQFNDYALGFRHTHLAPLLGDGIFTLDGEGWKHSRSMLRPQFAREQVAHVKALEPHLQVLAKHIRLNKGKTFDLQELFFKLTLDTSTEFLFGESVYSLYDSSIGLTPPTDFPGRSEFADAFNTSQKYLGTRAYLQFFYWVVQNREFYQCNAKVHKVAQYYVKRALNFTPDELEKASADGYIFLYELVKQTRDPVVLQDQLLNIMVAGRDTTAGLLSFTMFELARNPDVFEKLKQEIYEHFGKGDESRVEDITFESLKRCEYLKFVLNEALRLYPSVPLNFRVSTKDTVLPNGGGKDGTKPVFVGKGSTVAYTVYCTHRDEKYYGKDANVFRPERWANLNKLGWAYLPFNGGPRICLGQQFALTEASYVIVRLAQNFPNLVSKDDRPYPPAKSVHLTMCHQDGVFVELS
uniref:Alkane-inducible cytochrome P450 52A3 n=1 Tax=Saccharomyces cerevisiae TaxID=4932 RepID=A0A023IRJ6_YEASX|nr:alkane-inducible cytochrome P450 52A3 [Saccharomyces cerevisiae]